MKKDLGGRTQDGANGRTVGAFNVEREGDEFVSGARGDVIEVEVLENANFGGVACVMARQVLAGEVVDGRRIQADQANAAIGEPSGDIEIKQPPVGRECHWIRPSAGAKEEAGGGAGA